MVDERPDRTSAMVTAIAQGSRVEDLSARTPSSGMFANPDGSWTLESFAGVVRSETEPGKWVGIDPSLEAAGDGLEPAAVPFEVEYGDGGTKALASVSTPGGGELSLEWSRKLPSGAVEKDQVTFPTPGVENGDLVVTSHPEGFNFSVVLDQAPADGTGVGPEYRFPLTLSEGRFEKNADGSIEVLSKGEVVASITPPVMWDSADEPKRVPVDAVLEGSGRDRELVLRPDLGYLSDPERVYPVTVDPTVVLTATGDTWVENLLPGDSKYTSPELHVGADAFGLNRARSYLNFDTSSLGTSPASILDASVELVNFEAGSCSGAAIRMSQITSAWTVPGITWSSQPTTTATGSATNDTGHGFNGCTGEGTVDFDATAIVKSWVGGATNHGVQLKADNENATAGWRKYRSLENGTNTKAPKLTVTTSHRPDTPTSFTATPGLYGNYVTSKTPKLSAVVTDPDSSQVKGYFEIKQGATMVWSGTSSAVPSGGTASLEVPTGTLTEGESYTINAYGEDDVALRSQTPASKTIKVDTIAPTVTISSPQFTNNSWTTTVPSSATISLDGSADVGSFNWTHDGVTTPLPPDSNGDWSGTYTPKAGWHVIEVTPIDKAGNYGTPTTFQFGTGPGSFTTPHQWTPSTASFPIDISGRPSAIGATLQWRLYGETTWRTGSKVKRADGTNWTGAVTSSTARSTTGALVWNATEESYGTGTLKAPAILEVRGCFQYSGSADSCTSNLYLGLHKSAFGDRFPITNLGPAKVALHSGETMISAADADDSKAGIGRTFSSLSDDTLTEGVFGPGWSQPQILAPQADAAASIIDNRTMDGTFVVIDAEGGSQVFTPASSGSNTYKPAQPTGDATSLTFNAGTNGALDKLELSRALGSGAVVTTWEWKTSDTGEDSSWMLKATDAPGTSNDLAVTSTGQRPTFIRESDPGAAATCNATTQTEGCRALKITYTGTGTATRVSKVERVIGAATQESVSAKTLANYTYTSGKLTKVCGPAPTSGGSPLCTEYTYTTVVSRTMLATLKPAGLKEWRFAYDGTGRILNVKREKPAGGDATWSIDYSLTTTSSGLPDMSASKVAEWGQQTAPNKVYAVYQPHTGTTDVTKAQLFYITSGGITTNTATHGPDGWLVDTSWYDARGNTVQHLDSTGWARVQAEPAADRARIATEASSFTIYNSWGDANTVGTRVVDAYGPAHTAQLKDGTIGLFRTHTHTTFDDDPAADPSLIATRPGTAGLGLAILETESVSNAERTNDHDALSVKYGYEPLVTGDPSGWTLGKPTTTSTQLDATTWSTHYSRYDSSGQEIEWRAPGGAATGGAGSDARTLETTFYSATGSGDCGGKPAWAGLPCKESPAAQPSGGTIPVVYTKTYNSDLRPTLVEEISGGVVNRTVTTTYDSLGRVDSRTTATSGSGVTNETIITTFTYDPSTGFNTSTSSGSQTSSTGYDAWGRRTAYTDASGMSSSYEYDAAGEVDLFNDGSSNYDYAYDGTGTLIGVSIGGIGTFRYTYTAAGDVKTLEYPNGILARRSLNETGEITALTYTQGSSTLLAFTETSAADGGVRSATSPEASYQFMYDRAGRLMTTRDHRAAGCTTRTYGFDEASNRTSAASYAPAPGGGCQDSASSTTQTSTFDSAGRITDPGYVYDSLARATGVPAGDTAPGASGDLSVTYHANNMVRSLVARI